MSLEAPSRSNAKIEKCLFSCDERKSCTITFWKMSQSLLYSCARFTSLLERWLHQFVLVFSKKKVEFIIFYETLNIQFGINCHEDGKEVGKKRIIFSTEFEEWMIVSSFMARPLSHYFVYRMFGELWIVIYTKTKTITYFHKAVFNFTHFPAKHQILGSS